MGVCVLPCEGTESGTGSHTVAVLVEVVVPEEAVVVGAAEGTCDGGGPCPGGEPEDGTERQQDDVCETKVELMELELKDDHGAEDDPREDGLPGGGGACKSAMQITQECVGYEMGI